MEIEKLISITKSATMILGAVYLLVHFVIGWKYSIVIAIAAIVSLYMMSRYMKVLKLETKKKENERGKAMNRDGM